MFTTRELSADQVAQAFPLIRLLAPGLHLDQWGEYTASLASQSKGKEGEKAAIMTVQSERGYIHGLFAYAIEADLEHGQVLSVENFIAPDNVGKKTAVTALLNSMEEVARRFKCSAIHVHLPRESITVRGNRTWVRSMVEEAGYEVEAVRLCKALPGAS